VEIREARPGDLPAILQIQTASPEAAGWSASAWEGVLAGHGEATAWVAVDGGLVGYLLCRMLGDAEAEVLNVAVDPARRRRGAASALLGAFVAQFPGDIFLEVRASNAAAIALYRRLGFTEAGSRPAYYHSPVEDALVMRKTFKDRKMQPKRD